MRIRNIKNKDEILNNCPYIIKDPYIYKNKWNEVFKNNNKIYLEIGTGKCKFIIENACKYKDINFIGIELNASVLALGSKNIPDNLDNLKLINVSALELNKIFSKEIDTIYLNFSDPWPKKRNIKRRLTSPIYLDIYDKIFRNDNIIIQKTDNRNLFEYSLITLSNNGYIVKDVSLDLHNDEKSDNINTEYEDKFVSKGQVIYMLNAYKRGEDSDKN